MKSQSFTLIELLVVIAIVGILAGIIIVSMSGATDNARLAKAKVFSTSVRDSSSLGIVSEWTFDELTTATNGTSVRDSWGNSNGVLYTSDGTVEKLKTGNDCVFGNCISFDGTDDYIDCGSNLPIGLNSFTFSLWAKTSRNTRPQTVIKRASSITGWAGQLAIPLQSDRNAIFYVTSSTYSTTGSIYRYADPYDSPSTVDGKWHYYVGICDRSLHKAPELYIDGNLQKAGYHGYCDQLVDDIPLGLLTIGGVSGMYFQGSVDDVRIFNIAIKSSQLKDYYTTGLDQLLAKGEITSQEYWQKVADIQNGSAKR
jgi:prepilin-type N-terminal cleavage/methylation domain-containing protein